MPDTGRRPGQGTLLRYPARVARGGPLRPVVFFFCRLGDMVMLTALLEELHRRYQLPSHVVGAGSWNSAVFAAHPHVAQVWSFGRHVPFVLNRSWREVRRALREAAPGPIYVCEEHYRQLPRIRRMLALAGVDRQRCLFIAPTCAEPQHLLDRLAQLASRTPAALRASDYPPSRQRVAGPKLYLSATERAGRKAWLQARGWAERPLVLIQPGNHRSMSRRRGRWRRSGADDKAWPLQRWVALLQRMHARLPRAVLVLRGAYQELPLLQQIQAAAALEAGAVAIAGQELREFFALCEVAHSMVSVDTGPAHAAAAFGLPLVILYGVHSPLHWLPRSPSGSPLLGVGGPPAYSRVDQISLDTVFDAWCSLLDAGYQQPAHPAEAYLSGQQRHV